jgi:hypothetical protein
MATVQIELPDQLVQEAERAGLLSPAAFEEFLRERLRARSADEWRAALDRMDAADDTPYMSPEEIAEEIKVMRAERRAAAKG